MNQYLLKGDRQRQEEFGRSIPGGIRASRRQKGKEKSDEKTGPSTFGGILHPCVGDEREEETLLVGLQNTELDPKHYEKKARKKDRGGN